MRRSTRYRQEWGDWLRTRKGDEIRVSFARQIGISLPYLDALLKGLVPSRERLIEMAQLIGDDPQDWLRAAGYETTADTTARTTTLLTKIAGAAEIFVPKPSTAALPVLGTLRGGTVTLPAEIPGELFYCTEEHAQAASYVIRVVGDSLSPLVLEGDLIAFKEGATPTPGDIVIAKLGDEVLLKRYIGTDAGMIRLEAINPDHPAIEPDHYEIVAVFAWLHRPRLTAQRFGR